MGTEKNQLTNKQLAEALSALLENNVEMLKKRRIEQIQIDRKFIEELKAVDLKPNTGDLKELYQSYNKMLEKSKDEINDLLNGFKYARKMFFYSTLVLLFSATAIVATAWFFRDTIVNKPSAQIEIQQDTNTDTVPTIKKAKKTKK